MTPEELAKQYADSKIGELQQQVPELVSGNLATISIKTLSLLLQDAWVNGMDCVLRALGNNPA